MFNVKIKEFAFQSLGQNTIFESAKENALFIEHSCLSGRCGNCKAKLIAGSTKGVKKELGLTEIEKAEGYILTCVHQPTSDIVLDVEILQNVKFIKPKTLPTKISSVTRTTENTIKLVLRFPPNSGFEFLPGQYVNLIKSSIKRSYSIASAKELNTLEFYIKNHEQGQMSKYLFGDAKENDLLRLEGPLGSFFLRENSLENIIFLATGTGIAPILSMLQSSDNRELLSKRNIYLFHGGRFKDDLIKQDLLRSIDIHYYPTLSREKIHGYYFGYIQNILLSENIDLNSATVYACGSEKMINDAKSLLIDLGLHPKEYYSDAFLESN
jgi:CDP-4-dehydro-6-deoxyglucose reductase